MASDAQLPSNPKDVLSELRTLHEEICTSDGGECEMMALVRRGADEIERLRAVISMAPPDIAALAKAPETCEQPWMVAADRLLEKIGHVPGIEHERKALLAFMPSPNAQKTFPPAGPVGNTSPVDTATGGKPAGGDALKAGEQR